ncbi:MAG: hypothetical protein ACTSWY_11045 [Promethearchaeota archaeon]
MIKKLSPKLKIILKEIGGGPCLKVSKELLNIENPEITDDKLAEKCEIKLNIVRKMLYVLYDHKLAEFRKLRDKKSGWFIYYWHQTFDKVDELILLKMSQVLEKLRWRLKYERENVFYICNNLIEKEEPEPEKHKELNRNDSEEPQIPREIMVFKCHAITTFDNAMENEFKCKRCGGDLTHYDNEQIKTFLANCVAILRERIKAIT